MRIILAILIWVAAASVAPAAITVTPGGGGGVITTNEFDGSAITSGTVADARIASTIARDSEVPAIMATNRAADLVDADTYIGAYYIWNQEKIYVTHGNLTSQRVIGYYDPPTTTFSDPVIWYDTDFFYIAHTLKQFVETNKFAILRADSSLTKWNSYYTFDCSSASNRLGDTVRTCWSPRIFKDADGSNYLTISLSTNLASAANMRLFVTRALDNTFTNWTPLVMLTNSLDVPNYAGTLYKSNDQYQVWTKYNGQYMEIHVATNIYGPWSAYKTGNWVTWAGPHEQAQPIRDSRGRWTVLLSNGGEFKQYYVCATNDNLDVWSTAKAMENSLDTMNGGVWPVTGKNPIGAMTYLYYNGSNSVTGHRFVTGKVAAGGPGNTFYTVYHAGGTDTWLALRGSVSAGIAFDPENFGTTDFFIARRFGDVAGTYSRFHAGTQNVSFYGQIIGNGQSLTNIPASAINPDVKDWKWQSYSVNECAWGSGNLVSATGLTHNRINYGGGRAAMSAVSDFLLTDLGSRDFTIARWLPNVVTQAVVSIKMFAVTNDSYSMTAYAGPYLSQSGFVAGATLPAQSITNVWDQFYEVRFTNNWTGAITNEVKQVRAYFGAQNNESGAAGARYLITVNIGVKNWNEK